MNEHIEIIECRDCESKNCDGCNVFILSQMLNHGKFNSLMDEYHTIISDVAEVKREPCDYCQKFDDPCEVPMIATEEDECDRGIYLYNGYLCANGGSFCDAKVKFCPMCGRRLDGDK